MALFDVNPSAILELLKAAYYAQTGEQIQIGSDAFAASAAQSYAWGVLLSSANEAANNLFVETASGEYLDIIAKNYGIAARPEAFAASATFSVAWNVSDVTIPTNSIVVSDGNGHKFTNVYPLEAPTGTIPIAGVAVLFAVEIGEDYNGIDAEKIKTIEEGAEYIESAANVTETTGGTNGFPYTDAGNEAFRAWLMREINTFAGAGTYKAFEAKARNADSRIVSVYVLKQSDSGYEKGKVQVYVHADPEVIDEAVYHAQEACADPAFRPIGDLVIVSASPAQDLYTQLDLRVEYESRFSFVAQSRTSAIIAAYAAELETQIGKPFLVDELCHRLCAVDENGVYATDAFARNTSGSGLTVYPDPGKRIHLVISSLDFSIGYIYA